MLMRILPLFVLISSCGTLRKWALRTSTPVFEESSKTVMKESNWDFFQASTPGNLKFLEVLYDQDPSNMELLSVLIKSYAGYSFGVHETLAFGDELAGIEDSISKKDAIFFYTRVLDYGLVYLAEYGIQRKDLLSNDEENLTKKLLNIKKDQVRALLYTAQAWGSLINLQKDNVFLVSQVPKVKMMFDRVCSLEPEIDQNVCEIFYAQYEASRPKMLGGNPEKGERLFLEAIKKHPQNLLIRVNYIQASIIPMMDQEKYEKEAAILKTEFELWSNLQRDSLENVSPYRDNQELNLYNAIAQKRFQLIEKYKSKIF